MFIAASLNTPVRQREKYADKYNDKIRFSKLENTTCWTEICNFYILPAGDSRRE